jgi:hypothetical protein
LGKRPNLATSRPFTAKGPRSKGETLWLALLRLAEHPGWFVRTSSKKIIAPEISFSPTLGGDGGPERENLPEITLKARVRARIQAWSS